jgi:hypothetical protein
MQVSAHFRDNSKVDILRDFKDTLVSPQAEDMVSFWIAGIGLGPVAESLRVHQHGIGDPLRVLRRADYGNRVRVEKRIRHISIILK